MNRKGTTAYERRLDVWATTQRQRLRIENSTGLDFRRDRVKLLERDSPGLLRNGWRTWERTFGLDLAWLEFHDGAAPTGGRDDPAEARQLADWIQRQRWEYSIDNLAADRVDALDAKLPGWSARIDISWIARLERYREWVASSGGCAPRPNTDNNLEAFLHRWSSWQQELILTGDLPDDLARALLAIRARTEHGPSCQHVNEKRVRPWRYAS